VAKAVHQPLHHWVKENGYVGFASSIKGGAEVNWDNAPTGCITTRDRLHCNQWTLKRLLRIPAQVSKGSPEWRESKGRVRLNQLIGRDIERKGGALKLKKGVAKDGLISVQDPEMRHDCQISSKLFNGYKAAIAGG
jgi:hypothetical protein